MKYTEKVELLNTFFVLIFSDKSGPWEFETLQVRERIWKKEDLPLIGEDLVRSPRQTLYTEEKSMYLSGMHSEVFRELTEVIAEQLSVIWARSLRIEKVPKVWG